MAVVLPVSALKALVNLYIQANGVKAITGPVLQSILNDIIDSLESDYDTSIATAGGSFLKLDGSTPMAGNIQMNGNVLKLLGLAAFLETSAGSFGTTNVTLEADGIVNLKSQNDVINFKGPTNLGLSNALTGLTALRQISWQNKNITVAGLDDITSAIANLVDSSPATLDTLNELAAALGDDPNFATTVTNLIAAKLPLAGGTMTGDIETNAAIKNSTGDVKFKANSGQISLLNLLSGFYAILNFSGLTASRGIVFQDKDHTVAGLDDIKKYYFFAASDETSPLIASIVNAAYTDYLSYAMTVQAVMINCNTAPTGAKIIVDIKKNGTTIFTTLISIDATENTSLTAATPYVLDGAITFAQGDKLEAFITQVGSTIAGTGLKVKLL